MKGKILRQYMKDFRTIGAVAASSRYLVRKMLRDVDVESAGVIIEYGPGTGVYTKEIVRRMQPDTKLVIIEYNESLYNELAAKYSDNSEVYVVYGSAENVRAMVRKLGIRGRADLIVSGLPFAGLPAQMSRTIMAETKKILKPNGTFVTFQYTLFKKQFLSQYFKHIYITHEMRNIPPAYVFRLTDKDK